MSEYKQHNDMKEDNITIGKGTNVKIGFVIGFFVVFTSIIWWAASVNAKLDSIITNQTTTSATIVDIQNKYVTIQSTMSDFKLEIALDEVAIKTLQDKPKN